MRDEANRRRGQPGRHPDGPTSFPFEAGFFVRLGEAAQAIGEATFHETLLGLFGGLIAHDSVWIIRYAPDLAPEVLHTVGVPDAIVAWYRETYSAFDPFAGFWRAHAEPGVTTLGRALTPSAESELYVMVFQVKAGFADELAVLLALSDGSCMALFLQRNQSRFTPEEEALARLVFPALSGLHHAHVGRLLLDLHPERPSLIVDSGGRALLPPITPRERDILALILKGHTTGEIAQSLGIGKGTIKNYRLRLYRKANVGSERALVALFMPLLSGLQPPVDKT